MSLRKQFGTDAAREVEGVEVQFGENADKTIPAFRIARATKTNKLYSKALEKATRPYRRQIDLGTMSNSVGDALFMGVFVDTLLLGWSNVKLADVTGNDADTGDASFNRENAIQLLTALPELYEDLQEKSKQASLFRDDKLDDEAGN